MGRATKSLLLISSSAREIRRRKGILVLSYDIPAYFSIYFHELNHTLTLLALLGHTLADIP